MGLFSLATSGCPPSFGIGTISDSFHGEGNTDVKSELFMISVKIGRIAGRASFTTAICHLSFPGALFEGNNYTILLISKDLERGSSSKLRLIFFGYKTDREFLM